MSDDQQVKGYLRKVRTTLRVPRDERRRILEELENHLDDGAATRMSRGESRTQAVASVIDELGAPEAVAAAFNVERGHVPSSAGAAIRWFPILLPALHFAGAAGVLVWSLTWIAGGMTVGEQVVQRGYLRRALVTAVLWYAAYFSIKRADGDHAWRWAAWLCTGVAVLIIVGTWTG
jgi:hypothetical protein